MAFVAPKIDERTAKDVQELCAVLMDMPAPFDPKKGVSAALIDVFSRLAELIIERLNHAPHKNFLAFLDLLGASPLAPQPARVPLTFQLAAGSAVNAVVPAGTQVAAPPAEGEKEPTIFETEQELVVTAAQLTGVYVQDPERDMYADHSSLGDAEASPAVPIFQGNRQIEHILYLSHDRLFNYPALKELRLSFAIEGQGEPRRLATEWEVWDGIQWTQRTPESDTTLKRFDEGEPASLAQDGEIRFINLSPFARATVKKLERYWLRCRSLSNITQAGEASLPVINRIDVQATAGRTDLQVEKALLNDTELDLSKDFFPFGEKPKYGDTLYLMTSEAFAEFGSTVSLDVDLVNPSGEPSDIRSGAEAVMQAVKAAQTAAFEAAQAARENGKAVSPTPALVILIEVSIRKAEEASNLAALARQAAEAAQTIGTARDQIKPFQKAASLAAQASQAAEASAQASRSASVNPKATKRAEMAAYEARAAADKANQEMTAVAEQFSSPILRTKASDDLKLRWEFWNGRAWVELGTATKDGATGSLNDATRAFTQSGEVRFTLPDQSARTTIAGVEGYWLRVRIVSGNYGAEAHFKLKNPKNPAEGYEPIDPKDLSKGYILAPASFAPPSISSMSVDYSWTSNNEQPETILTYNDFVYHDVTASQSFKPFEPTKDEKPAIYLGFTMPSPRSPFPNRKISLFNSVAELKYGETEAAPIDDAQGSIGERLHLSWEYWNGTTWARLLVRDESVNFTQPGLIEFLGPSDFARQRDFGIDAYWVRVRWQRGQYGVMPRWRRLLLNTIMAAQTTTIDNEVLGSSDGRANQKFRTTRAAVLPGQQLVVREPEMPSAVEEEKLISEEGGDAINIVADSTGRPREIWVRWHEVPDFYGSSPRDRHYVLDHLTGDISFGDGERGLIPPSASGNIEMAKYQTGGGASGNKLAGTITQLKTTVPYVDNVTNLEAAAGGADAETLNSLIARAPRALRHQNRAVTLEDYEDLAMLASPDVARALCVPLYNLAVDPNTTSERLGTVSLVIVPRSDDPKPSPSLELIDRVRDYIDARRLRVGELVIVGPEFIRVDVEVVISLTSLDTGVEVEANVLDALSRYLHPLTGGLNGTGWDFGRKPYKSDLYALLEAIDGVDHINMLDVVETEDREGIRQTGRFMVYSGLHKISLTFEEE